MIYPELLPLFKTVAKHLLTQNKQSCGDGSKCSPLKGQCLYKGPNSLSCAVGCLIKDEFYTEYNMEGQGIESRGVSDGLVKSGITLTPETVRLLKLLQYTHDDYAVEDWKLTLIDNAIYFFDMEMDEAVSIVNSLIEV